MLGAQKVSSTLKNSKFISRWEFFTIVGIIFSISHLDAPAAFGDEAPLSYNHDIRPILSDKCFFCHGPDEKHRKRKLRLDDEASAKKKVIIPGDPKKSKFIRLLKTDDEDDIMPPLESGKTLTPKEIALLERWVKEGANYEPYWAYVPPKKHTPPKVKKTNWPLNFIDHFLLDRMEKKGFQPNPEADKRTLIRRLYFDFLGLPPKYEDVEKFVNDSDPKAYEAVVDRLLESQHFGERMAVYWLDLVRYADTVGYHGDQDHSISPYRDYVIKAFNKNIPFDQFTREQLAGDLLPNPTLDQKVATGYNRLLQTSHEGGVQPKEYIAIYQADRVRNVSQVWMGATLGCAQCHDHKYDPLSLKDFYSMGAFFADVDEEQHFKVGTNALPTRRPPEITIYSPEDQKLIENYDKKIAALQGSLKKQKGKDEATKKNIAKLQKLLKEQQGLKKKVVARGRKTMITVSKKTPRTVRVLPRGNWLDDSGPIVQPQVPITLGKIEKEGRATRLDLADWLTDPKDGVGLLTARVFANRFWYMFYGEGLSRSLDDFGGQGEPPVAPKLLDRLAIEFIENGWDVKKLVKTLVMSRAYRQSSVAQAELVQLDPYNRYFTRNIPSRLPAEFIRDNLLAASGLLVSEVGGKSIKPYQPAGYYKHLNFPTRKYRSDTDERQWKRGVYMHWQRQFLHPMLKVFDAPNREECTAKRARSNTPLAALVSLNAEVSIEAARVFAQLTLNQAGKSIEERLSYMTRRAIQRDMDATEKKIALEFIQQVIESYKKKPESAKELIEIGNAPVDKKLDPVELAIWTQVARGIFNLPEMTLRN